MSNTSSSPSPSSTVRRPASPAGTTTASRPLDRRWSASACVSSSVCFHEPALVRDQRQAVRGRPSGRHLHDESSRGRGRYWWCHRTPRRLPCPARARGRTGCNTEFHWRRESVFGWGERIEGWHGTSRHRLERCGSRADTPNDTANHRESSVSRDAHVTWTEGVAKQREADKKRANFTVTQPPPRSGESTPPISVAVSVTPRAYHGRRGSVPPVIHRARCHVAEFVAGATCSCAWR